MVPRLRKALCGGLAGVNGVAPRGGTSVGGMNSGDDAGVDDVNPGGGTIVGGIDSGGGASGGGVYPRGIVCGTYVW